MRKTTSYAIAFLLASLFILSALPAMGAGTDSQVTLVFKNTTAKDADASATLGDSSRNWDVNVPANDSSDIKASVKAPQSGYGDYEFYIATSIDGQPYKDCYLDFSNTSDGSIVHPEFNDCKFGGQATLRVDGKTLTATFIIK